MALPKVKSLKKKPVTEVVEKEVPQPPVEKLGTDVPTDKYASVPIGATVILSSEPITLNGREYFKLYLGDNTTAILSEKDIKAQTGV